MKKIILLLMLSAILYPHDYKFHFAEDRCLKLERNIAGRVKMDSFTIFDFCAVIYHESGFRYRVQNANATGYTQIKPAVIQDYMRVKKKDYVSNSRLENLRIGAWYLNHLYDRGRGTIGQRKMFALRSYRYGIHRARKDKELGQMYARSILEMSKEIAMNVVIKDDADRMLYNRFSFAMSELGKEKKGKYGTFYDADFHKKYANEFVTQPAFRKTVAFLVDNRYKRDDFMTPFLVYMRRKVGIEK